MREVTLCSASVGDLVVCHCAMPDARVSGLSNNVMASTCGCIHMCANIAKYAIISIPLVDSLTGLPEQT